MIFIVGKQKIVNMSLKLVVVGEVSVGKTSLLRRVFYNSFDETDSTIGASFFSKTFNGVTLNVWDTAGQERYHALLPMYIRNADVAWIVTDGRNNNMKFWKDLITEQRGDECQVITVQTKMDLLEQPCHHQFDFYTSAKMDIGCNDLLKATIAIPSKQKDRECMCMESTETRTSNCCY